MNTDKIRELNDEFRKDLTKGKCVMTSGISALCGYKPERITSLVNTVKTFNDFNEENDPFKEHDFGSLMFDGTKVFWKIDYYDKTMKNGSNDPSNEELTTRVLTIMKAEEY